MRKLILGLLAVLLAALPSAAATYEFKAPAKFHSTTEFVGAVTQSGNQTVGGTLGVTGATTLSSLTVSGNTTHTGTLLQTGVATFSAQPVFSIPLVKSNVNASIKRQVVNVRLSPETGAAADGTVYRGLVYFGRAGTVTKVTYGTAVDPVSGTNVIAVEKGSYSGNTMLSTATVSLNGTTAFTAVTATLTATGADLALLATEPVALEYNAGTQGAGAQQVTVSVEFEPSDI